MRWRMHKGLKDKKKYFWQSREPAQGAECPQRMGGKMEFLDFPCYYLLVLSKKKRKN